jgi:hypothetical protein
MGWKDKLENEVRRTSSAKHAQEMWLLAGRRGGASLIGLVLLSLAGAGLAAEPPNKDDLTQGNWELVPEKSTFCKPAPQKSRREILDAGWGLISVYWTGVDFDGKEMSARYVYRYDGDKYPSTITEPAEESITWELVNPSRVEFIHWSKDNEITEELVRTVSSDGQEMTQSRKYLEVENCVDIQVFRRV